MGMLLRFSAKSTRSVPAARETEQGDARVLLFTGVRYERELTNAQSKPARRTSRTRKGQAER